MRDIPFFTTELGAASLTLSQIPYTQTAYIRIQDTDSPAEFLKECISFCKMAGAEVIYATGHNVCLSYPFSTSIIAMQAKKSCIGSTEAYLMPVTEKTIEQWRGIYNDKAVHIPNGAWMTLRDGAEMLQRGSGYFVYKEDVLLGIGKTYGNQVQWIASVHPGGGEDILKALCRAIAEDIISLEVADSNKKALDLYTKLGFVSVEMLSQWYRVK